MSYVLYHEEGYGKVKVLKRSNNVDELERFKESIFAKKWVIPTIFTALFNMFIFLIIGLIKNTVAINLMYGFLISMLILIIGIGVGGLDFTRDYYILYEENKK